MPTKPPRLPQSADPANLAAWGAPSPPQQDAQQSQYVLGAMLAASQDGCDCRACKLLRKVNSQMTDQLLED